MKKLAVCWSQFSQKASDRVRISANLLNLRWKPTVSQVARAQHRKEMAAIKACSEQKYSASFCDSLLHTEIPRFRRHDLGIVLYFVNLSPSFLPQSLVPVTNFVKSIFLLVGLLAWFFPGTAACCSLLLKRCRTGWSSQSGFFMKKVLPSRFNLQTEDIGRGMWPCTFSSFILK